MEQNDPPEPPLPTGSSSAWQTIPPDQFLGGLQQVESSRFRHAAAATHDRNTVSGQRPTEATPIGLHVYHPTSALQHDHRPGVVMNPSLQHVRDHASQQDMQTRRQYEHQDLISAQQQQMLYAVYGQPTFRQTGSTIKYETSSAAPPGPLPTLHQTRTQPDPSTSIVADDAAYPQFPSEDPSGTYVRTDVHAAPQVSDAMIDAVQSSLYQPVEHQYGSAVYPSQAQQRLQEAQQEFESPSFAQYKANIRNIFTLVQHRNLRDVPELLLQASQYLLSSIRALGLNRDEFGEQERKLELWDEYNQAWLTTMQCQLNTIEQLAVVGRNVHSSQTFLDYKTLETLSKELIDFCDHIQGFGLVDYQMGVAEDRIIEVILHCLAQFEENGSGYDTDASRSPG